MSGMIAVYSQDESISIQPHLYQGTMSLLVRMFNMVMAYSVMLYCQVERVIMV